MSSFVKASGGITPNSADPGEEFPFLHTISVVDRVVSVDKPELVQNNIKTETVTLNLDSEWEGLSTVINIGNEKPVSVIWSGEPVVIPAELMTTVGSLDVSVVGYGDDGGIRAVTKKATSIFNVVASGFVEGDEAVPDPTTILGQLTEAADRANQAADRFNQASEDIGDISDAVTEVKGYAGAAKTSETKAASSATAASQNKANAASSAAAAKQSETNAADSATAAQQAVDGFGLEVGMTTTGEPGSDAAVEIQKTGTKYTANFAIPRGENGQKGEGVPDGGSEGQVIIKADDNTSWVDSDKLFIEGFTAYQYLDNDNKVDGEYYSGKNGNSAKNEGYIRYPSFTIPAGKYYAENISLPFTWGTDSDGSYRFNEFSEHVVQDGYNATITLDKPMTVYFTCFKRVSTTLAKMSNIPITSTVPLKSGAFLVKTINEPRIYHVGSTREYTKIKDAVAEAIKYPNSKVYLDGETFDLVEEFGLDYLNSFNPSDSSMLGIVLENDVSVIGTARTKIVFNYQGGNEKIHERFSPFLLGYNDYGGFTLENLDIKSINCRYTVHDEAGGKEYPNYNHYVNCTFYHDSSNTSWGAHQSIGGGLGRQSTIIIENCHITTIGGDNPVSYHNCSYADAKSLVVVKDSWISGNTLISNLGLSDEKSRMIVCGCSLGKAPNVINNVSSGNHENVELVEWGNTIRQ